MLEHYVAIFGQDYLLQVKYSKGSLIILDVIGFSLLLYEVPYISVPTILKEDSLTDEEYKKIVEDKNEQELLDRIRIKSSKVVINDPQFETI
jgi:hypothetical protein